MNGHVFVSLFESIVFPNIMKVIPSDHYSSLHFHFDDNSSQDPTTNGHVASERAFLVNVCSIDGLNDRNRRAD